MLIIAAKTALTAIVRAKFNTPGMAMRMIKNQKFNPKMKENKLWASENRSPTERRQLQTRRQIEKIAH